ncbi:MAG: histidinol dehydrogenase, partial [Armatimonadetes bacterium]|nr:histidinol dehydrogenase [Armatimonadota bacterium]
MKSRRLYHTHEYNGGTWRSGLRRVSVERDGYGAALEAVARSLPEEDSALVGVVRAIVLDVRERGDDALLELGRRFDAPCLDALQVPEDEWEAGCTGIDRLVRAALDEAGHAIEAFHEPQRRSTWMTLADGEIVGQMLRPLDRVGVYVPGGLAEYPSSVLMTAIPARVAGVPDVRICTPARRDGSLSPSVLYAARMAGAKAVYRVGGAQAIAAMAYGTATVPGVDKIVGPGNAYVSAAKRMLWGVADMDMVAGPSEVCVVADAHADAAYVAADMLTQAEHDPDCAAFLVTPDGALAGRVEAELTRQLVPLARRQVIEAALEGHGAIVVTRSLDEALEIANACAPEHMALMVADPMAALAKVRNAGAVFLGGMTPQT